MSNHEFEYIKHSKTGHCKLFLAQIFKSTPQHWHSDLEFLLVLDGSLAISSHSVNLIADKQDMMLFNSYEPHRLTSTSGTSLVLVLQFSPSFCRNYYPALERTCFHQNLLPHSEKAAQLKSYLLEMASSFFQEPQFFSLRCIGLLNLFTEQLFLTLPYSKNNTKEQDRQTKNILRMQSILSHIEHYYTEKLLLSDISEKEGLSLSYLSHLFKETLGISFQSYLKQLRFEKAVNLLSQTESSILDISIASGFSDIKYLNQLFIQYLGCTPGEYRRRLKEISVYDTPISYVQECSLTDQIYSENFSLLYQYYPNLV